MSGRLDAGAFFRARFADLAPGEAIEIRPLGAGGTVGPRRWFTDPDAAAAYALALPSHWAVYYGVCLRRPGGGKKGHIVSVPALWGDVDDKRFPAGRAGALAALAGFPLAPTWLVDSGGGLQPYWELAAPLPIAGPNDPLIARVEGLLQRLYARLGGLDSVQDLSRILRVPGTLNRKYDPPRPVTVVRHDPGRRYTLAQFEVLLPAPPPSAPPAIPSIQPRFAPRPGIPSPDEVCQWLRHIPPIGDYKDHWVTVLAAIHSLYPGPEGEALAEEWSPGKPGEIARKFASFGRYRGLGGPAGIGTLVYLAKRGGWQSAPRARFILTPKMVDTRPAVILPPKEAGHAR